MDNNELDKKIKEKLANKIEMSDTMKAKLQEKIQTEKDAFKIVGSKQNKFSKAKKLRWLVSVAAVFFIVVGLSFQFNKNVNNSKTIAITSIKPTKMTSSIIENTSEFLIETDDENATVEDVQRALYVDPPLDYTIQKTSSGEFKLKFKQNIPDNTIVKLQYVKDKITENSWAYQTEKRLSVTNTYPSNTGYIYEKSIIEIEFSYANVEDLEDFVQIYPETDGKWEHLGKTWRFTPSDDLEEREYTVSIKKGLRAGEEELEEDYKFTFSAGDRVLTTYSSNTISVDKISTFKPGEQIKIYGESNDIENGKIEIYKFNETDEFLEYLNTRSYKKAKNLGEYKFSETENCLELKKSLEIGYYTAVIKNSKGREIDNVPIQINNLAAYALESERDIVVWVADGNDLAKGINVEYLGKKIQTDKNGIAKFENVTDDSEAVKYLTVGDNNKLIIGIYNTDVDNYPYSYMYTDRLYYKNTDTIKIWAFVPIKLFYDEIDENEFYIELENEGKQKVNIDSDGNINFEIKLNNHIDARWAELKLYYRSTKIAWRTVQIENYELKNYTYEVIKYKDYAYNGEKYEFDVKVKHITGVNVVDKKVEISFDETRYSAYTGEDGIAHFEIPVSVDNKEYSSPSYVSVAVYNGDTEEYSEDNTYFGIRVFLKKEYTEIKYDNNDRNILKATLYKLDLNRDLDIIYDVEKLYDGVYNTKVKIYLNEMTNTRYKIGDSYDEYSKENIPIYEYVYRENKEFIKEVETQNGEIQVNIKDLPIKESTDDITYSYRVIFEYDDEDGNFISDDQWVSSGWNDDEHYEGEGYNAWEYSTRAPIYSDEYYTVRYVLKKDKDMYSFSIGDELNFTIKETSNEGLKDVSGGQLLQLSAKEGIYNVNITKENQFNYKFSEEDFPNVVITSAYFKDGKFYRMPVYTFDYNEADKEVDIEIIPDKEEYKPGDEVNLTIKTSNNGKAIPSSVNISVVNKAAFGSEGDDIGILYRIYEEKSYFIYKYSTFRDYLVKSTGGGRRRRRRS